MDSCQTPLSTGISQARILGQAAISYSRDLPDPVIEPTSVAFPALAGRLFNTITIREAPLSPFLKVPSWLSACLSPHGYSLQWQGVSAQTTSLPLLRLPLSCLPHSWSFCFIFLLPSCIGNLPPAIATLLASSWVFEITMVFHCVLSVARSEL